MSINHSAINLLEQLRAVIIQLTAEQFKQPIPVLSNSSIGQHVRHTLEFFICLQDAHLHKEINYDERKHDQFIETDVKLAAQLTQSLKQSILRHQQDFSLVMKANYEVDTQDLLAINSTYFRELAYNIEHAIHHMALIKVGIIAAFDEIKLPDHFGVASSTVRYQKSLDA